MPRSAESHNQEEDLQAVGTWTHRAVLGSTGKYERKPTGIDTQTEANIGDRAKEEDWGGNLEAGIGEIPYQQEIRAYLHNTYPPI